MIKQFFGTAQVARFLGVHADTVRSYVKQGLLVCGLTPPGPQGKSHRRYGVQDLLYFMSKNCYTADAINEVRVAAGLPPERPPAVDDVVQLQLSASRNTAGTGLYQLLIVAGSDIEECQLLDFYSKLKHLIQSQNVQQLNSLFRASPNDNKEEMQAVCCEASACHSAMPVDRTLESLIRPYQRR